MNMKIMAIGVKHRLKKEKTTMVDRIKVISYVLRY